MDSSAPIFPEILETSTKIIIIEYLTACKTGGNKIGTVYTKIPTTKMITITDKIFLITSCKVSKPFLKFAKIKPIKNNPISTKIN